MKKAFLEPLSGFRDFRGAAKFALIELLREIFESFGYEALETPSIERQEILLNKLGREAQKQLYLFEDNGQRKVGLRYDLTVSLARFVASGALANLLPYKRFEIGNVWRAEKAQAGRFRQFTQADIDIVGSNSLACEKELLEIVASFNKALSLDLEMRLNDRRLVDAVLRSLDVKENQAKILQLIDKKEKISPAAFKNQLSSLGLGSRQSRLIEDMFSTEGQQAIEPISSLVEESLLSPVLELVEFGNSVGLKTEFSSATVRGLDYYTGIVFEVGTADANIGSLIAGGRYDNLIGNLGGENLPAVGLSFGIDRLITLEKVAGALNGKKRLFIVNEVGLETELRQWAEELRLKGAIIELYFDATIERGKQLRYADRKHYALAAIVEAKHWREGTVLLKNLISGESRLVSKDDVI